MPAIPGGAAVTKVPVCFGDLAAVSDLEHGCEQGTWMGAAHNIGARRYPRVIQPNALKCMGLNVASDIGFLVSDGHVHDAGRPTFYDIGRVT
jgi:hypothetical protein